MAITKQMGEIYQAYESGIPVDVLAVRYNISKGSVLKKVAKVQHALNPSAQAIKPTPLKILSRKPRTRTWDIEAIRLGIDKFFNEQGRLPTARDYDEVPYLPSARQVQRAFGGLVNLRKELGYVDIDYTKGELRKVIASTANKRGITAEDYFEPLLISKFGEPYVHVQKRYYKGSKNRYDFLVYAQNKIFGVDIFTTDRANYIDKNIRHKIQRYKHAPSSLDLYFVLVGEEYSAADTEKARVSVRELVRYPNMHVVHESEFIKLIDGFTALSPPPNFLSFLTLLSK